MKSIQLIALAVMFIVQTSCSQKQESVPESEAYVEPKDIVTSFGPHLMVRNIKQDRNGHILIAGSNSSVFGDVYRYDGKSFTNLSSKLDSHRFWDVMEDSRGNLWFTSLQSGVYRYDGRSIKHFTTEDGLPSNSVMSVYEDKTGNIWFGGGGISRYDGNSFQTFTTKDGLPRIDGGSFMEDKTGKLWVVTWDGPCFFDGKEFTVLKDKDGRQFTRTH